MAIPSDVLGTDNPNQGRTKINAIIDYLQTSEAGLKIPGNNVRALWRSANARFEDYDGNAITFTGRKAFITFECTSTNLPAQGTGDSNFREGDAWDERATEL